MYQYILIFFVLSLSSTSNLQTTEDPTSRSQQTCSNNTDLVSADQFSYGEPEIDEGANLAVLGQLVDGPLSSHQVYQVATRLKLLQIPKGTTAELQPLDVNFNRQYKKFVKRVTERAIQERTVDQVTSREGLMNLHSLIWNQFASRAYSDMIRHAWHNTDPDYSTDELTSGPPVRMVQEIQFDFDPSSKCDYNCTDSAFIRCSHCGKILCLKHFLERRCFHDIGNGTDPAPGPSGSGGSDDSQDELRRLKTNKV